MFNKLREILGMAAPSPVRAVGKSIDRRKAPSYIPKMAAKQKEFVPTPNDPEYYATRGATNEAEAQSMVNEYRQGISPGIKPLFGNFHPKKLQPMAYKNAKGSTAQFHDNPTFAGNLNPKYEDGYDSEIGTLRGTMQQGRMPMDMDLIPGNFTGGRTGYYQGSNPFSNIPTRNVYNNINPTDMDEVATGSMIQAPSFTNFRKRR